MNNILLQEEKKSIWDFSGYKEYQWFRWLVVKLLLAGSVYLILHFIVGEWIGKDKKWDYEYVTLDERQQLHINRIYFDSLIVINRSNATNEAEAEPAPGVVQVSYNRDSIHHEKTLCYLKNEFNYKIDPDQLDSMRKYLLMTKGQEATSYLAHVRLKVRSYFWLVGPSVYFEILFWALFGVISSLLFNLGLVISNRTTNPNNPQSVFDASEIPSQIAKLLYAPLCTLAIVLGYNFLTDSNIIDISSSKGVIVFAFIGGFFSSRLIAFLDRLKEVILPQSGSTSLASQQNGESALLKNVRFELSLDKESLTAEEQAAIMDVGLDNTQLELVSVQDGKILKPEKTGEDQTATFVIAEIKAGRYQLRARWSQELQEIPLDPGAPPEVQGTPLSLEASGEVQITSATTPVPVVLRKAKDEG